MNQRARVTSIDALRRFKAAFVDFGDEVQAALQSINADINRTLHWVQYEQLGYWKAQFRQREKDLAQARLDLQRKEMGPGRCVDERRAVERAKQRLEEARRKVEVTQRWAQMLPRELELHTGPITQLNTALAQHVPAALGRIDAAADALDKYLALHAPSTSGASSGGGDVTGASMARPTPGEDLVDEDRGQPEDDRPVDESEEPHP